MAILADAQLDHDKIRESYVPQIFAGLEYISSKKMFISSVHPGMLARVNDNIILFNPETRNEKHILSSDLTVYDAPEVHQLHEQCSTSQVYSVGLTWIALHHCMKDWLTMPPESYHDVLSATAGLIADMSFIPHMIDSVAEHRPSISQCCILMKSMPNANSNSPLDKCFIQILNVCTFSKGVHMLVAIKLSVEQLNALAHHVPLLCQHVFRFCSKIAGRFVQDQGEGLVTWNKYLFAMRDEELAHLTLKSCKHATSYFSIMMLLDQQTTSQLVVRFTNKGIFVVCHDFLHKLFISGVSGAHMETVIKLCPCEKTKDLFMTVNHEIDSIRETKRKAEEQAEQELAKKQRKEALAKTLQDAINQLVQVIFIEIGRLPSADVLRQD